MTIQIASAIVSQLGPCRIAVDAANIPSLPGELALLGCDVGEQTTGAIVIQWASDQLPRISKETLATYSNAQALVVIAQDVDAVIAERLLFQSGWQRHPGTMTPAILAELQRGKLPELSFYIPAATAYSGILNDPDPASLAEIARWALVCERVRSEDQVLLWDKSAVDGQRILEGMSRASGIALAPGTTEERDARAFDLIVAFDPPGPWETNVRHFTRLLKLDGRLILGWPEDSLHRPESWELLDETLADDFLIETRFVQLPGRIALQRLSSTATFPPGWMVTVAAVNPIGGEADKANFRHPAFEHSAATMVDFAAGYDNPWLYRSMVQMGERLTDEVKLARLAEYVAENARVGSADQGAALTVLGYRVLEHRADAMAPVLLHAIEGYHSHAGNEPHVIRWCVSLAFLAGRLSEMLRDRTAAKLWYGRASGDGWKAFSSILATKAVSAAFFMGRLLLAEGDATGARSWFQRGVDVALEAAGADHGKELGTGDGLLPFYLPELAEVIDMGSQCANALANLHLWDRNPGLFWKQVDVKRFGIAAWTMDVMKENARLSELIRQG